MIKDADDTVSLPLPFPLPKHYSADVEVALRTKKMSTETTRRFVSSIAGTMLTYKRYPSQEDYRNVTESVIPDTLFSNPRMLYMYLFMMFT